MCLNVINECLHDSDDLIKRILYLALLTLHLLDKYGIINSHRPHALHLPLHRHALFGFLDCSGLHSLHLSVPPPNLILSLAYILFLQPYALCLLL